jgi:hypothetical protein
MLTLEKDWEHTDPILVQCGILTQTGIQRLFSLLALTGMLVCLSLQLADTFAR